MASNVVTFNPGNEPAARIEGDTLVLDGYRERDPRVIALVEAADDIDAIVHDCLVVGATGLTAARATQDVVVVEKAFGDMTSTFSRELETFTDELDAKTRALLDGEDGALPRSFETFKAELEELLDGTFDPDSKKSALAKLEEVMRRAAVDQVKAVRGLIDPDNEESPLGRYRSEIVKSVREESAKVHEAVQELKTKLAVDEARAEMFELTTKKGFTFEEELEHTLVAICEPHGDVAERVGGTPGTRGRKGDFLVTLNPDDTAGQDVRYVLEAKNKQLNLRDTLRELDGAIANRDALAGIAVFARFEQCSGDTPFHSYGNRALVVHDPTDGDDAALRLACCWARWVVRRQLAADGDSIDLDRVGSLIEDARQALRVRSTIDRALATSTNKIAEAKNHLGTLVDAVESALGAIEGEIAA
jgi:hypothetical protein